MLNYLLNESLISEFACCAMSSDQWNDDGSSAVNYWNIFSHGYSTASGQDSLEDFDNRSFEVQNPNENDKKKISDAVVYGPRFCILFDAYCKRYNIQIDVKRHLMALCYEHIVAFIRWARESDEQVNWISATLLKYDYLRPEVRNGIVMVLIYTFSSMKATVEPKSDMFVTLQDNDTGLGIANRFSLKIYNDPLYYLTFLKISISGLIDAGAIPENERSNLPNKKSKQQLENSEEIGAFHQIQKLVVQLLDRGYVSDCKTIIQHLTLFWQHNGNNVRNRRFICGLNSLRLLKNLKTILTSSNITLQLPAEGNNSGNSNNNSSNNNNGNNNNGNNFSNNYHNVGDNSPFSMYYVAPNLNNNINSNCNNTTKVGGSNNDLLAINNNNNSNNGHAFDSIEIVGTSINNPNIVNSSASSNNNSSGHRNKIQNINNNIKYHSNNNVNSGNIDSNNSSINNAAAAVINQLNARNAGNSISPSAQNTTISSSNAGIGNSSKFSLTINALRFERIGTLQWEIKEIQIYDLSSFIQMLLQQQSHSTSPLLLIDESYITNEIQSMLYTSHKSSWQQGNNNNNMMITTLSAELQQRKALVTSWPLLELKQFRDLIMSWQDYCHRNTTPTSTFSSMTLLDYWKMKRDNNNNNNSSGNMNKATNTPIARGLIVYEIDVKVGIIIRACPSIGLHEDIWINVYPNEIQAISTTQTFGEFLEDIFPQLHALHKKVRRERRQKSAVLPVDDDVMDVTVRYFAIKQQQQPPQSQKQLNLDGSSNNSIVDDEAATRGIQDTQQHQSPHLHNKDHNNNSSNNSNQHYHVPSKALQTSYQTIGMLSTPAVRVLSRIANTPLYHDFILDYSFN